MSSPLNCSFLYTSHLQLSFCQTRASSRCLFVMAIMVEPGVEERLPCGECALTACHCCVVIDKTEEVDLIYQVLKQAGDLGGRRSTHGSVERDLGREVGGSGASSGSGSATSLYRRHPRPTNTGSTLTVNPAPVASSSGTNTLTSCSRLNNLSGCCVDDLPL